MVKEINPFEEINPMGEENMEATIYAVRHGKDRKVTIEELTYKIVREKAPLFSMGTPDPRSFERGKRGIIGDFIVDLSGFSHLRRGKFDIFITIEDESKGIHLQSVEVLDVSNKCDDGFVKLTFVCEDATLHEKKKQVQEVNNREMAVKVLELSE